MKYKYVTEPETRLYEEVRDGEKVMYANIECFRTGVFEHPWYGKLNIDKKYLNTILKNWKDNVFPTQVSFDRDHNPASGAMAWIPKPEDDPKALYIVSKTYKDPKGKERSCYVLMAKVEMTDEGYSLVKSKKYKYFSSEINPNYRSYEVFYEQDKDTIKEEDRVEYGPVLVSGGLTNRPYIVNLEPISLSFSTDISVVDETEVGNSVQAHGSKDELMLFSNSFAGKPKMKDKEKEEEEDKKEDEYSKDKDEDDKGEDLEEDSEVEDSSEDKEDDGDEEEDKEDKPSFKKTQKSSLKGEYENSEPCQGSVSASDAVNSQNSNQTESRMNLSEILAQMASKPATNDQIAHLEQYSTSATGADKIVLDSLLASKRDLALKEREAVLLEQKRKAKEDEVAALTDKVVQLSIISEQNKQLAYAQRVEVFCNDLDKAKHFPAVVSEIKSILCSIDAGQRDYKFSVVSGNKTEELDAFDLVKRVLDALPEDARFSAVGEQFSASGSGTTDKVDKTDPKPEQPAKDKYDLFYAKYSADFADEFATVAELRAQSAKWDSKITDEGELKLSPKFVKTQTND